MLFKGSMDAPIQHMMGFCGEVQGGEEDAGEAHVVVPGGNAAVVSSENGEVVRGGNAAVEAATAIVSSDAAAIAPGNEPAPKGKANAKGKGKAKDKAGDGKVTKRPAAQEQQQPQAAKRHAADAGNNAPTHAPAKGLVALPEGAHQSPHPPVSSNVWFCLSFAFARAVNESA